MNSLQFTLNLNPLSILVSNGERIETSVQVWLGKECRYVRFKWRGQDMFGRARYDSNVIGLAGEEHP